jgi:prepilin-type N-terminal cleavage/methylation domain-containing protein
MSILRKNRSCFTLLEVVVAIAILAMGIASALTAISMAQNRVFKAERQWLEQHLLTQAAEYILLARPNANVPPEIFDNQNYYVRCEYMPAEGLSDDMRPEITGWKLVSAKITLIARKDQREASSVILDRIVRSNDQ